MRTCIVVLVASAFIAASCEASVGSPSVMPSATEDQAESLPPASPGATSMPSASESALVVPDFRPDDYVEVVGSGLAVRSGPGVEYPLVPEYLLGRTDPLVTTLLRSEVRLPAGYVVRIVLGPIVTGETAWFAVDNVPQDGQSGQDTPVWRTTAPIPYSEIDFELTWMAVAQPGLSFVRPTDAPACTACFDPPAAVAAVTGTEDDVVEWVNRDLAWITVAAAGKEAGDTCQFRLGFAQGDQPPFIDQQVVGYFEAQMPPMEISADAETASLAVGSDCSWAVMVRVVSG